eukprot:TRINITY_DN3809_c0_g1_i1.p1 TRINITY_DN3809_c0_g1~~TRINITY_DN3809_c0_g1_i1.p1  ORF type:complete len:761 (-),score=160.81 TRINITY_DN3809_c0_g1_i1:574-2856(-)
MAAANAAAVRRRFVETPAPANYVAGLGRGATGFTTRSDIGPMRSGPDLPTPGMPAQPAEPEKEKEKEEEPDDNPHRTDDDDGGLFFDSANYDKDDAEADAVWDEVDRQMDLRRKARREARLQEQLSKFRQERPKIQQQFADLKERLADMDDAAWAAIPDIGDYTQKGRKRHDIYTPVPDTLLAQARAESEHASALDPKIQRMNSDMPITDLNQIGSAQKKVLGVKLDQMSDSVTGQTVVDPKGYLTNLQNRKITSDAEIGDIKKARLLLKSVRTTNPKHGPAWVASARLEEVANKLAIARSLIMQGCVECPQNEDVWLEAIRLQPPELAKGVVAKAVQAIPNSVRLWIKAADLEVDTNAKRRVFRRALLIIPNSIRLWKAAIELEEPDDARILLTRAVKCVPDSVELWLALAHLETYTNAQTVLNEARTYIPTDPAIWITAAKLEEAHGVATGDIDTTAKTVDRIIAKALKSLSKNDVHLDRDTWINHAQTAEAAKSVLTAQAIIRNTISLGVEDIDRKVTWKDDAKKCLESGSVETARAIFAHAISVFPEKKSLYVEAARLEKQHGSFESLNNLLSVSVTRCPRAEILWLMWAKEIWAKGDVDMARKVLGRAFDANPNSEKIWIAAFKVESQTGQYERARQLLAKARTMAGTERVWLKSAVLERQLGFVDSQRILLDEALQRFPLFHKLWIVRAQMDEETNPESARQFYALGVSESILFRLFGANYLIAAQELPERHRSVDMCIAFRRKALSSQSARSP